MRISYSSIGARSRALKRSGCSLNADVIKSALYQRNRHTNATVRPEITSIQRGFRKLLHACALSTVSSTRIIESYHRAPQRRFTNYLRIIEPVSSTYHRAITNYLRIIETVSSSHIIDVRIIYVSPSRIIEPYHRLLRIIRRKTPIPPPQCSFLSLEW